MENTTIVNTKVKAPFLNRVMLKLADKFAALARWCEERAIRIVLNDSRTRVFVQPLPAVQMPPAGYFGAINLDVNNPAVRAALLRGYSRSPRGKVPAKGNKKVEVVAEAQLPPDDDEVAEGVADPSPARPAKKKRRAK